MADRPDDLVTVPRFLNREELEKLGNLLTCTVEEADATWAEIIKLLLD